MEPPVTMQATERVTIRPWAPHDRDGVDRLHATSPPLQRWLDQWVHAGPSETTWVADRDGTVVGVAATRHSEIHPSRTWAAISVDPDHGDVVARDLVDRVRSSTPTSLRIRFADIDGTADPARLGLTPVIRCIETEIPGSRSMLDAWAAYADDLGVRVAPAAGTTLVEALRAQYSESHRWDPPASLDTEQWRRILLGDAIPGSGRIATVDGRVAAAAVLHPASPSSPCDAHLAFCGPTDQFDVAAVAATSGLLAEYGRWIGRISVECDVGPSGNTALAAALGAEPEPVPGSVIVAVT